MHGRQRGKPKTRTKTKNTAFQVRTSSGGSPGTTHEQLTTAAPHAAIPRPQAAAAQPAAAQLAAA